MHNTIFVCMCRLSLTVDLALSFSFFHPHLVPTVYNDSIVLRLQTVDSSHVLVFVPLYTKAVGTGAAWATPLFAADLKNLFGASYMTCTMPVRPTDLGDCVPRKCDIVGCGSISVSETQNGRSSPALLDLLGRATGRD